MNLNPEMLAKALAKRSKEPQLDDNEAPKDSSLAPGMPGPASKPGNAGTEIEITISPEGEMVMPPGMAEQPMPDGDDLSIAIPSNPMAEAGKDSGQDVNEEDDSMNMLGMESLSDADKEHLLGGKPGSLLGKVRQKMLMAKADSK